MDTHAPHGPGSPSHGATRQADLHVRLLHEGDPIKRATLHLELAGLCMSNGQFEQAGRHFREALHLDQTLDIARVRLRELGVGVPRGRTGLRAWFSRKSG